MRNSTKTLLKKIHKKTCGETLYQSKNHVGKHCNNPQCFKEQQIKKFNQLNIKKIKLTNMILKNKKIKQKNYVGKHHSNPQYFKGKKL